MNKTLNNVNKTAFHVFDETVGKVLNNQYVSHGLKIVLVLYCAFMADKLPEEVSNVLQYSLVRLLIVLCIAYSAHHDPVLAIVLSIAFVVSVQNLNHMQVEKINNENFDEEKKEVKTENEGNTISSLLKKTLSTKCAPCKDDEHNTHEEKKKNNKENENFTDASEECSHNFFTSDQDLENAQNNLIGELDDENSEIQSFKNQLGPQGIASEPVGHNL